MLHNKYCWLYRGYTSHSKMLSLLLALPNLTTNAFDRRKSLTISILKPLNWWTNTVGSPVLPRYQRRSERYESGAESHPYSTPKHNIYYAFTAIIFLLPYSLWSLWHSIQWTNRFEGQHIPSVAVMEPIPLKAANGYDCKEGSLYLRESCYENDIDWLDLCRHLPLLQDVIKTQLLVLI